MTSDSRTQPSLYRSSTSPHSRTCILRPRLVKSSRVWEETSSSRGPSRSGYGPSHPHLFSRPLPPPSTPLPWLNGVRQLQASATCFLTVSSVTASENAAATCFFPFFIGRAGPGSAGRFPFILTKHSSTPGEVRTHYFPPETTVPKMPHSFVPASPNGKAPKNQEAGSIHS